MPAPFDSVMYDDPFITGVRFDHHGEYAGLEWCCPGYSVERYLSIYMSKTVSVSAIVIAVRELLARRVISIETLTSSRLPGTVQSSPTEVPEDGTT